MNPESSPFIKELKTFWAKLDSTQRKRVVFAPCLLLALLIATHPVNLSPPHLMDVIRRSMAPAPARPAPQPLAALPPRTVPSPPVAAPPPAADSAMSLQPPGTFMGRWQGSKPDLKQGVCALTLELWQQQDKSILAYPKMSCTPVTGFTGPIRNPNRLLREVMAGKYNPTTAVMHGTWKDGAIDFEVEKITSTSDGVCAFASPFSLATSGANQVTAEWKDACGAPHTMQLLKGRQ